MQEQAEIGGPAAGMPDANKQPFMKVPEAGALLGLGWRASYDAAKRGEIPTIKCGRRLLVPTARFRALAGLDS